MNSPIKKYRPVLSASAISHILTLCKTEQPLSAESIEVISILAPFQAKVENAGVSAAYTATQQLSLEEKLGMVAATTASAITPEAKRLVAFSLWLNKPTNCTLEQLQLAETYRYENNLMNTEEETAYESKVFGTTKTT